MAFAIRLRTSSSDNYVFAFDGEPTQEEILDKLNEKMGDELFYVDDYQYDATYEMSFKLIIENND